MAAYRSLLTANMERLQKLIAQAGVASRRAAEDLIRSGEVTVNGEVVTELGTKADPEKDHIKVQGKLINVKIQRRENVYILLNKPKGYLSSAADPEGRKLVTDLIRGFGKLHPVGRLDFNTEGLIILTNDGQFTNKVASSKTIPKVYEVKVKGLPTPVAINKLRRGTLLPDGFKTAPAEIKEFKSTSKNGWYEVTLHEGHNQQIRKMFDSIGHSVVKLRRIAIGNLTERGLVTGAYRLLDPSEVEGIGTPAKPARPTTDPRTGETKIKEHSRALKPKKTFKRTYVKPRTDEQGAEKRPARGPRPDPVDRALNPRKDSFAKPTSDDRDPERRPARGLKPDRSPKTQSDLKRPFGKFRPAGRESDKISVRGEKPDRADRPEIDRPKKSANRTFSKPRVGEQGREKRPARGGKPPARRPR
jgi:23S rRNA pseudouridine2605 synthase